MTEYRCSQSNANPEGPCEKTRKRCSGCFLVFYCSQECQLADWEAHKHVCDCHMAARQLLRGDSDSYAVCGSALKSLAEIPSGAVRLNAAIGLMLAQITHERVHPALMAVAERELARGFAAAVAAALLQIIRVQTVLAYEWNNSRKQICELEHGITRLECSVAAAKDSAAAANDNAAAATVHFLNFSVSSLRSQFRPREQRRGLYWQALMQSRRYTEAYRKLVAAGELAPRALHDVWNPLARMLIRSRAQIMQYEHEFVEACREFNGSDAEPTDGIFETVAEFRRVVEEGLQCLTKTKNTYAVALLHWHTVLFYSKMAEAATSAGTRAGLDAGRRTAAHAGLGAARRAAHAPLQAVFEAELGGSFETDTNAESDTNAD